MVEFTPIQRVNVSLGTDPEIFAQVGESVFPAFLFLPRREEAQFEDIISPYHSAKSVKSFWDGFQAEFEVAFPLTCIVELMSVVRGGLQRINELAKKKHPLANLTLDNVIRLPEEIRTQTPDEFLAFGCMPSKNAYGMEGERLDDPRDLPYRFAGGHLHFGVRSDRLRIDHTRAVKIMDRLLGIWAVGAAEGIDNPIRRRFYGLAGEHRTPETKEKPDPFGLYTIPIKIQRLEYRTLSNFWLSHPAIYSTVFELGRLAMRMSGSDEYLEMWGIEDKDVCEIINKCDVKSAREYLTRIAPLFKQVLNYTGILGHTNAIAGHPLVIDGIFNIGMRGLKSIITDPHNLIENWCLKNGTYWDGTGETPVSGINGTLYGQKSA